MMEYLEDLLAHTIKSSSRIYIRLVLPAPALNLLAAGLLNLS
jgi:hypothetical protein